MPRKVSREDRKRSNVYLCRSKKTVPPQKRKNDDVEANSSSAKKIKNSPVIEVEEDLTKHYRIIDFSLVFSAISKLVKCVKCDGEISFQSCKKEGLGFNVKVVCKKCKNPEFIPSSERVDSGVYDVNIRFAFAMRTLGLGLAGCNKFCGLMDMASSFLSKTTYSTYISKMNGSIENITQKLFAAAVAEEKEETCKANNSENTSVLTVSGDGSWKKRGFSSLYGVSSLIGYYSGKVVDVSVKSLYCHECKVWENKLDTAKYEAWHEEHVSSGKCKANHAGPSGNMEVTAIIDMFERSEEKYGVKYSNYVGDGDSKTYTGVVNAKPYGENFIINKKECIGHVQKRMGKRLRELVKTNVVDATTKTGKAVKRKSLSGKGKLTAHMIDKLTVYYGLAIRRNHDSVDKMKNAIWATYDHYSSTDDNPHHDKCPSGEDSWCEWQRAKATKSLKAFKHSYTALPADVLIAMKPIYQDLSKDELLQRCLGGFTQNNNESFNQLVWKISPKSVSGTSTIVEIAANIAACTFNEGSFALLAFMQEMGIGTGPSSHEWARQNDELRITRAEEQASLDSKEERVLRRQQQKDALDILDGSILLYGPGIDDSV